MTVEVINTERLVVRSTRDSDLENLHEILFSDPEVMAQAFRGRTFSRQAARSASTAVRVFGSLGLESANHMPAR